MFPSSEEPSTCVASFKSNAELLSSGISQNASEKWTWSWLGVVGACAGGIRGAAPRGECARGPTAASTYSPALLIIAMGHKTEVLTVWGRSRSPCLPRPMPGRGGGVSSRALAELQLNGFSAYTPLPIWLSTRLRGCPVGIAPRTGPTSWCHLQS